MRRVRQEISGCAPRPAPGAFRRTLASAVEMTATIRELPAEAMILGLFRSRPYHSAENPPQAVGNPDLLKERTIRTAIGM